MNPPSLRDTTSHESEGSHDSTTCYYFRGNRCAFCRNLCRNLCRTLTASTRVSDKSFRQRTPARYPATRFMGPRHARKRKETFHEPRFGCPFGGRARLRRALTSFAHSPECHDWYVGHDEEISGLDRVSPYQVHGRNARAKADGGFP